MPPINVQVPGHGIIQFPEGTSPDEMKAALLKLPGTTAPPPAPNVAQAELGRSALDLAKSGAPMNTVLAQIDAEQRQKAAQAASYLPTVGGAIGGIVGGIPGAAVGGALGDAAKQEAQAYAGQALGTPTQQVKELGVQGALQGALQVGGDAAAAAAGGVSRWLMNRALTRVSAKLMDEFPDLADTLINNAITVSDGGYQKAKRLLLAAKSKATAALAKADATGAAIPVQLNDDLAESLKTALLEKAIKSGKTAAPADEPLTTASQRLDPDTQAMFDRIDEALANRQGVMDLRPSQADVFKTQLQKESRPFYGAQAGAARLGQRAMTISATERAEYAARLNDAIDSLAAGYRAANREAQPLIGVTRGLKQAIRPSGNLYQAMVRPAAGAALAATVAPGEAAKIPAAIAGGTLFSPAGMSREAIILAHPAVKAALAQLPRSTAAALTSFLQEELPQWLTGQTRP